MSELTEIAPPSVSGLEQSWSWQQLSLRGYMRMEKL